MKGYSQGGEHFNKMYEAGDKMGFATGGKVRRSIGNTPDDIGRKKYDANPKPKNTSKEFVKKTKAQKTMDHGNQPARKGRNQQQVEAGGTPKLKPGYKKGGKACGVSHNRGKKGYNSKPMYGKK